MDVTTIILTLVCEAAYPFREQLGLPFVDVLLKVCNAQRFFLLSIFLMKILAWNVQGAKKRKLEKKSGICKNPSNLICCF